MVRVPCRKQHVVICVTLVALSLLSPKTCWAGIVKNISTGIDSVTGTQLPNGAADPNYALVAGTTGGYIGTPLIAQSDPLPGEYVPDMASDASRWIVITSGMGLEGISVGPGTYVFQTTVDLTGFLASTAELEGLRYAADNKLVAIVINTTTVFSQSSDFAEEFHAFVDLGTLGRGAFQGGLNTIQFVVANQLDNQSPMALRVEGVVTAAAAVPEPMSLTLLGAGIASVSCFHVFRALGRRRRKGRAE